MAKKGQKQSKSDLNMSESVLVDQLISFAGGVDWAELYFRQNFSLIIELETRTQAHFSLGYLTRGDILEIARWHMPDSKIECPKTIRFDHQEVGIEQLLRILEIKFEGAGVLFYTTIIRFMVPTEAGSLDTELLQVFGDKMKWLAPIENRFDWLVEYLKWNNILGFLASWLNEQGIVCPHPDGLVREQGKWVCADVQMALSVYARDVVENQMK